MGFDIKVRVFRIQLYVINQKPTCLRQTHATVANQGYQPALVIVVVTAFSLDVPDI
jgi:hypothetical protein